MIFSHPTPELRRDLGFLESQFQKLPWNFLPTAKGKNPELISQWLGSPDEDIMVLAFHGTTYLEKFHRQDFFFINFVCENGYDVQSQKYNHQLHLSEGDCYIGQPNSGYALRIQGDNPVTMVSLHIRKELFLREYLHLLANDNALFHFFLDPQTNQYSQEYLRFHFPRNHEIWFLVGLMVREYAHKNKTTQDMLHAQARVLMLYLSRKYAEEREQKLSSSSLSARMLLYIEDHSDQVTLNDLARAFGYHPNYISSYLHKKTGRTFSEILLEKRMGKARLLLENTDLTIETISDMLGYTDPSHFYQAFRSCFHTSPRNFLKKSKNK